MPQPTAFAPDAATYLIIPALQLPLSVLPTRHSAMLRTAAVNAVDLGRGFGERLAVVSCGWHVGGGCAQPSVPTATGGDRRGDLLVSDLLQLTLEVIEALNGPTRSQVS